MGIRVDGNECLAQRRRTASNERRLKRRRRGRGAKVAELVGSLNGIVETIVEFIELSKFKEQPVPAAHHKPVRISGTVSKAETRRPIEIVTQPKGACGAS